MHDLAQLRLALQNPSLAWRELGRIPTKLSQRWYGSYTKNPRGTGIFDYDWDTLVILDACRNDHFQERNVLDGKLESRYTLGSSTPEYVTANFEGETNRDLVVVTANGHYLNRPDGMSRDLDVHHIDLIGQSSSDDNTVDPEAVTERALELHERFPNKRLIVHYVQPHDPYIGPTADANRDDLPDSMDLTRANLHTPTNLLRGHFDASLDVLRTCYDETLDIALENVADLLDDIDGRTVVTADHGEHLGERLPPLPFRFYGHVPGLYTEGLTHVPLLVYESGDRRDTVAERPVGAVSTADQREITDRLRVLGYRSGPDESAEVES